MEDLIWRIRRLDPHRLALAPLLGLLAGFLLNRAHDGSTGWALAAEMGLGALFVTFGATLLVNVRKLIAERDAQAALAAKQADQAAMARHSALVEAEAERYRIERYFREQVLSAALRAERLENELLEQRGEANALRRAMTELRRPQADFGSLAARLEKLEHAGRVAEEARRKVAALEEAQEQMRLQQVALDRKAASEAEELKASLLQLAISESQRMRNMNAPENDQSGRIVELETRIHRLAREIEALSKRSVPVAETGAASLVQPGGTQEKARIGFLQAMLDANKTLRRQIKEAA
jgi:hypothetical protein